MLQRKLEKIFPIGSKVFIKIEKYYRIDIYVPGTVLSLDNNIIIRLDGYQDVIKCNIWLIEGIIISDKLIQHLSGRNNNLSLMKKVCHIYLRYVEKQKRCRYRENCFNNTPGHCAYFRH